MNTEEIINDNRESPDPAFPNMNENDQLLEALGSDSQVILHSLQLHVLENNLRDAIVAEHSQQLPNAEPVVFDHTDHLNGCALVEMLATAATEARIAHENTRAIISQIRDFVLTPRGNTNVMIAATIGQLRLGTAGEAKGLFLENIDGKTKKDLGILFFHRTDAISVRVDGRELLPIHDETGEAAQKSILAELALILGSNCVAETNGLRATLFLCQSGDLLHNRHLVVGGNAGSHCAHFAMQKA